MDSDQHQIDMVELSDWLTDHKEVFHTAFQNTRICIYATQFSLLNDPALATTENFNLVNRFHPESEMLLTDDISEGYSIQYALGLNLYKLLTAHFEKANVRFGYRGFIRRLLNPVKGLKEGIYCQVLGQDLSVGIVKQQRLVFFNKYNARNAEDLLYYLLLCFQSHEMDPKSDPLYISGLIEKDSPMFRLVFDYVRNVQLDSGGQDFKYAASVKQLGQPHYFVNLLMAV